jgi:glycosyl transferase, family 25
MGKNMRMLENVLYINLAERTDRKEQAEKEFARFDISAERVEAVKGNPLGLSTQKRKPGDIGCILSHVKCVQLAKDRKWNYVVVFEDDVEFRDEFDTLFWHYFRQVPDDWDMIFIGGNHWGRWLEFKDNPQLTRVTENVFRTTHTLTTHAYILRDTMYDAVIKRLTLGELPVDMLMMDLQTMFKVYAFRPNLAWQRPSKSDINNNMCDYVYFLKDW